MRPQVDLVIPVYNEEAVIENFHQQLVAAIDLLPYDFQICYVNDGSGDATDAHLETLAAADARVRVIELSRNFGHQAALSAGLDSASGDYVITLDGDGQHPPALIADMLRLAQGGCDIVFCQRMEDAHISAFKRRTSEWFYTGMNWLSNTKLSPGVADFRLMSRVALDGLRQLKEYHRFLRGLVAWMGFRSVILPYEQPNRLAGKSKYSLRKMLRLAMDAIFSFSLTPLYISLAIGGLLLLGALLEIIYVLSFWLSGNQASLAPGWSSLMFVLLFVGGSLMIALGLVGIYIGYIFQEVKRRPPYLVRRVIKKDGANQADFTNLHASINIQSERPQD